MDKLSLYFRYALRSFLRGRTRSLFGAFCVAVGIASVVALGLVGANFKSALARSGQVLNRGDVSVTSASRGFNFQEYRYFAQLKAQGRITDYTAVASTQAELSRVGGDPNNTLLGSMNAVDPKKFPFYDTVTADTPPSSSLATLLRHPGTAVVGHDVFDGLHLHIGDRIQVITPEVATIHPVYTVTGVIPDTAVSTGVQAAQLGGNVMVDRAGALPVLRAQNKAASDVFMKTRDAGEALAVKKAIEQRFGTLNTTQTAADAQKSTRDSVASIDKFFGAVGLCWGQAG
jgi:predicted lysophospholipase L1 biosynthesis ABC-type transport system permease subunit